MTIIRLPRKAQRRLSHLLIILFVYLSVWFIILPPDSPLRLALNFNLQRLRSYLAIHGQHSNRDTYLYSTPAINPTLNLSSDVGYLIKTGYGTRHRLPDQLEAFRRTRHLIGEESQNYLVVGDWSATDPKEQADALGATVHDALKMVLEAKLGVRYESSPRFVKYRQLQQAVDAHDEDTASSLGKTFGWELDAVKFMLGMDLLYHQIPRKKWYIILDDDTYLVHPSLHLLLSHLDHREPLYLGNAVGDYRGRFAHGGSAVVLSGEAMRRLFDHPDIVLRAYLDSLEETWGDKLVATTLQKVGVYLDERYNHHFNGEYPAITRLAVDRFCSPIVSFHGLRQPGDMARVGRVLGLATKPVLWGQLWDLFASYPMQNHAREHIQMNQDHVGDGVGQEDSKPRQWPGIEDAEACKAQCDRDRDGTCLAWTFVSGEKRCITSPWTIIGEHDAKGKVSGVNWPRLAALQRQCPLS